MGKKNKIVKLELLNSDKILTAPAPAKLTDILSAANLDFYLPCGGSASCGKCVVRFVYAAPEPVYFDRLFFTPEELRKGYRLGCQCVLTESAAVELAPSAAIQTLPDIIRKPTQRPKPLVRCKKIRIEKPSLNRQISLEDSLQAAFRGKLSLSDRTLIKLADTLHNADFKPMVVFSPGKIIDIFEPDTKLELYGVAIDIGTTTLAVSVHNLLSGKPVDQETSLNPQSRFGDDLISRLSQISQKSSNCQKMHTAVIDRINKMVAGICRKHSIQPDDIVGLVASGNAVMNHLFLNVNPRFIGYAPFAPVFKSLKLQTAQNLSLDINREAIIWILPNIGGYVGGDIISDMIVAGFGTNKKGIRLLIDIGTNCEVVMERDGLLLATSSPAGPAMEGACIKFGMRAEPGAVYDYQDASPQTIQNEPARGICGSGLLHIVEHLWRAGIIDYAGKLQAPAKKPSIDQYSEITIAARSQGAAKDINLTQSDIREFQLARAAIVAAWRMLCHELNILPEEIEEVYIAGAFGNYIRPDAALSIGLIPEVSLENIHFIGNASLEGARMVLMNRDLLTQAANLADSTKFIELAGKSEFQILYVDNMHLPKKA